jgi:hypothetical protein
LWTWYCWIGWVWILMEESGVIFYSFITHTTNLSCNEMRQFKGSGHKKNGKIIRIGSRRIRNYINAGGRQQPRRSGAPAWIGEQRARSARVLGGAAEAGPARRPDGVVATRGGGQRRKQALRRSAASQNRRGQRGGAAETGRPQTGARARRGVLFSGLPNRFWASWSLFVASFKT